MYVTYHTKGPYFYFKMKILIFVGHFKFILVYDITLNAFLLS